MCFKKIFLFTYIKCIECNPLCLTCSNSNTCDLCKDDLMFGESLCTVPITGNYLLIIDDEIIVK